MNAQDMFKELGYFPPKIKLFSFRNGHVIPYFRITIKGGVERIERIHFFVKEKDYSMNSFTRLINNKRIYSNKFYDKTSLKLHQAIHQQMIELGWLYE